jgi:hypothetical protein
VNGGRNAKAIGDEMIDQLTRVIKSVPAEERFPCGHKRLMTYCTDPEATTWDLLYELHYLKFEPNCDDLRKMSFTSVFRT